MATAPVAPVIFVSSTKTRSSFDPLLARDQLKFLNNFYNRNGAQSFCNVFLRILAKKEIQLAQKSRLIPFKFSRIQADLQNKIAKRNITLKPRQIGSTTFHILCRLFIPAILNPGTSGLLISQTKGYGAQHFRIMQRALKSFGSATPVWVMQSQMSANGKIGKNWSKVLLENMLHTQYSARHEILFDFLDSKILVESAENPDAGTGLTINNLVATEVAYWTKGDPETLLAQAKETVPADGTIDLESTPNGMGGYFYEEWQRSTYPDAEFRNHFYPWWWQDEYTEDVGADPETMTEDEKKMAKEFDWTMGQLQWRRNKVISLRARFQEKYPENSKSCVYGNSVVRLADGSARPISSLVSERYSGRVLTVDKNGRFTTAKVTGWYRSKRANRKMYRLMYAHSPLGGKHVKQGVTLTGEHQVLTSDGWRRVDSCNGSMVATGTPAPGPRAFQVILGTVLGDGYLGKSDMGCTQIALGYIRKKVSVLEGLGAKAGSVVEHELPRHAQLGFRTENLPYFTWLRKEFYPKGKKIAPMDLVEQIDDFGIAVWFMDDGWTNLARLKQSSGSRFDGGIALGVLPKSYGRKLASLMTARGYSCSLQGKEYTMLKFSCDGMANLLKAIAKYITPDMRYKLPSGAEQFEKKWFTPEEPVMFWDKAIVKRVSPPKQKNGKYEKGPLYCLDVEGTHNFVTLGGVVHNCFMTSGELFFDKDVLIERKEALFQKKPLESFQDGQFRIYRRRIMGRRYVIGADPAEGNLVASEDPDLNAAVVLDIDSGEMMADYASRVPQEDFAIDLQVLGEMYNNALVIVERNIGQNVLSTLQKQLLYGNVYLHKDWWKEQKKVVLVPGWPTNVRTRPHCLNSLKALVFNASEFIHSERFVDEALTFVWTARNTAKLGGGRVPKAQQGCHDDMVMAGALASIGRDFVNGLYDPIESPSSRYGDTGAEEDKMG